MAENDGSSFPKFQMFINKQERWLPLHEAGRMYDYGYAPVEIGEQVYDDYGVMRPITDEERQKIVDVADEWSENK